MNFKSSFTYKDFTMFLPCERWGFVLSSTGRLRELRVLTNLPGHIKNTVKKKKSRVVTYSNDPQELQILRVVVLWEGIGWLKMGSESFADGWTESWHGPQDFHLHLGGPVTVMNKIPMIMLFYLTKEKGYFSDISTMLNSSKRSFINKTKLNSWAL